MGAYQGGFAVWEYYLIYLRKSRQDDPRETVEEVLAKHETMLQEYAQKELGGRIPEENIYREVVSGESIDDREEVQKVLARIEDPNIKGVLVIEPQRLSRGDLEDCGRLISDFRYTHTKVVTPYMTYDLENKMERKFFQDELLRGRDYLEYTKEILLRGRIAAVKRGCYIGNYAPYGYKKIKIGKDHTLEIIEEEAEIVRMIFDLYIKEGLTPGRIANKINSIGVKAPRGDKWVKDTIRVILRNEHYTGKVVFNKYKETTVIENGVKKVKCLAQPEEEIIVAEGKHAAIIGLDTWEAARKLVARHPRQKYTYSLKNPLSGVLVCGKCGRAMSQHPYKHAEDRYECKHRPRCYKSVKVSHVDEAVIVALEEAELPALELKVKNGDGKAVKIQQKLLEKLEKQMEGYREQEDKQFEFLETGRYSQDVFDRRNAGLRAKMEDCQKQIYQTKASMPKDVDYAERVVALQAAIDMLKDPEATPAEKNTLLRAIVERIEYTGIASDGLNKTRNVRGHNPFSIKVFLRL
jgi:DNA invertase Pin-like site-specific DNA recombinase